MIVESPAKARTIGRYLGEEYDVKASVGHIRDIPVPRDLPAEMKKGPYGKFGVDVENGFDPYYIVSPDKKKTVAELKKSLKDADTLYLATDEDREGEAIAWHLLETLKPKKSTPVKRMVFHEITKDAIQGALENTRDLDAHLVDAQETRRILDRLVGFELSPVLWRKIKPSLSAGRVQSVATRLVVERERERMAFVASDYWDVTGTFGPDAEQFTAKIATVDGARVATGSDFADDGTLTGTDGCNNFESTWTLESGSGGAGSAAIVDPFPVTKMACAGPWSPWVVSIHQVDHDGDRLTATTQGGTGIGELIPAVSA